MTVIPPQHHTEHGFTLVEIIVSTAIFVSVVASMLTLFNYTLQINRRVQALREVVQSTRTFTETLSREIRNGRIDYNSWSDNCRASNYTSDDNRSLAIVTTSGEELCFYINSDGRFLLDKQSPGGQQEGVDVFNSTRFQIIPNTFHFYVRPKEDPNPDSGPQPGIQPFVTIVAQFQLTGVDLTPTVINYQTTISTDVYDIPPQS